MKKTSEQHYGTGVWSLFKFAYYSGLCRNTFIVFSMNLDQAVRPHELDSRFSVLKPTAEELDRLREGKDLTREFFYDRMHGVRHCYLVMCGDEIAGIHWVYVKGDPNRFLKLNEGVAEVNYLTTTGGFRGNGLMGKMMAYSANELRNEGYRRLVCVIHQKNEPAIRNALWVGLREVGRIRTFGPFNPTMPI